MIGKFLQSLPQVKVLEVSGTFIPIDLSDKNPALAALENSTGFESYIERYLKAEAAKVAYGGYNETRNLYKRSAIFNDPETEERNIHIGLDLWTKAGTSVLAALDGKVHGFDYNAGIGNYGPTIILEHEIQNIPFYTLYGHLSVESIENIEIGDLYRQGQKLATLGDSSVNGDYAPHLHFQVIVDIGGYFGDYPGVCSKSDLPYYLANCPDPNLLLKIKQTT